jgi:hypothetical protein
MKRENNKTPFTSTMRSQSSGRFQHRKVDGVFFMIKLPKRMPIDICDRCIEELSQQIGKLEVDFLTHKVKQHVYDYRKMNLDFEVLYWNQCKKLTLKGQPNE